MRTNHKIVILEGADGTGKTTLAEALVDEGYAYIHCTYNAQLIGHMTGYFIGVLSSAIHIARDRPVVIDRWRMSELVYGNVFRAGPENPYATDFLFQMADDARVHYAFCHPKAKNRGLYLKEFEKLKAERKEMYDKMGGVYDAYAQHIKDFVSRKPRSFSMYDRFETTVKNGADEIIIGF
jgi:thymidylate kinase